MKIYFDGCSWTHGTELENKKKTRFSKLISDYYNAEEYNLGEMGGCNRRIARNLLDHNLDDFDLFVIQMSMESRTEYYDEEQHKFVNVRPTAPHKGNNIKKLFWNNYYEDIYNDKFGYSDELIYYNFFRSLLKNKRHIIITISKRSKVPIDMDISLKLKDTKSRIEVFKSWDYKIPYPTYRQCMAPFNHPNELGHKIIAEMLTKYLDKT